MKYPSCFIILAFTFISCNSENGPLPPNIICNKGLMTEAMYEFSEDIPRPFISGLENDFIILVDTNNKTTNFFSRSEVFLRDQVTLDATSMEWYYYIRDWYNLNQKQKLEKVREKKIELLKAADSIHFYNNNEMIQVYLLNNTMDTISMQMQDASYICILQAKAYNDKWYPIQYWQFSGCGNSYFLKDFPPKTANSFIAKVPSDGNFQTKLRYKLLGKDKFYFSNEFTGNINYCEFLIDSAYYTDYDESMRNYIYLDSLINLQYEGE